jgi:hypothetical protein
MKLLKKKASWLIFLLLFFTIFSPHISVFNFTIKTVYLFVLIPSILGFIKFLQNKRTTKFIKLTFFLLLFSLFYNIILYFSHGLVDISWIIQILFGFIELFAAFFIGDLYIKIYKSEALNKLLVHLFYVGIIHSILMLIIFISPAFRNLFYSFIVLSELAYTSTFRLDNQTRFSGLLNSGFGSLSVLNAITFLLGLYSYIVSNKINLNKFISGSLLLFISSILSGRLGIIVMLIVLLFFYVLPTLNISIFKRKVKLFLFLIPTILFFLILLNNYFPEKSQFAFEAYFKYLESGTFDNSSELILSERLDPNFSYLQLLFGTGNYKIDYADSGYIIMMNGGGIVGSIISYSFLLSIFSLKYFKLRSQEKYKYILFSLIFIIFFINYKNLYFFGYNDIFQIYFLVTCTSSMLEFSRINIDNKEYSYES